MRRCGMAETMSSTLIKGSGPKAVHRQAYNQGGPRLNTGRAYAVAAQW